MLSPFEWWCRNFILPDICKPCLFVFLRNLFYLTAKRRIIDKWAEMDIAAELGWERSTVSKHIPYILNEVKRVANRITKLKGVGN